MKISVRNGKCSVSRKKIFTQKKEKVETTSKCLFAGLFSGCFSVSRDDTKARKKMGLLKEIKRSWPSKFVKEITNSTGSLS